MPATTGRLTKNDQELLRQARVLVGVKKVRGGTLKAVGCALVTEKGKIFKGVCLDLRCGIGFCAEHSAIAAMVTHSNETHIQTIVAVTNREIIPPCGRCRELMSLLDKKNLKTNVIISHHNQVALEELLPFPYNPSY